MNSAQIDENWEIVKGKLQQEWSNLTNDVLDLIEGNRKEIAGRIQRRCGYNKKRAGRKLNDWMKTL